MKLKSVRLINRSAGLADGSISLYPKMTYDRDQLLGQSLTPSFGGKTNMAIQSHKISSRPYSDGVIDLSAMLDRPAVSCGCLHHPVSQAFNSPAGRLLCLRIRSGELTKCAQCNDLGGFRKRQVQPACFAGNNGFSRAGVTKNRSLTAFRHSGFTSIF
jgi:hypothetical protein